MEQGFGIRTGDVPGFQYCHVTSLLSQCRQFTLDRQALGWIRAELLQFLARDDHRVSQRFLVQEWKGKRHVLIELLQVRDIGATLSQDLAYFFWRFEKLVVPE